jgi:hypothetical protein
MNDMDNLKDEAKEDIKALKLTPKARKKLLEGICFLLDLAHDNGYDEALIDYGLKNEEDK